MTVHDCTKINVLKPDFGAYFQVLLSTMENMGSLFYSSGMAAALQEKA